MIQMRQLDLGTASDFELMATHIGLLYEELFGKGAAPPQDEWRKLSTQIHERRPRHWAFIGTDGETTPVAFVALAESFSVFAHGHYGIINERWVRADKRSEGVGGEVIDHVLNFGRKHGWQRIDVSAPPPPEWDRSFAFYEKRGFIPTGRKLKYLLSTED
jgi:GNAT superfamily N-acetyltransferase